MQLAPLEQLAYFTEWGGRQWESLVRDAIQYLNDGNDLAGMELLEIGTRYGKMALFFSLLGAQVTAVDISAPAVRIAQQETERWLAEHAADLNRQPKPIRFVVYDGSLDVFAANSFDIVFTKSVLVVVPQLEGFLQDIAGKLRQGGRIAFLENAKGNSLLHAARAIRHRRWNYRQAHFFTKQDVQLVERFFKVNTARQIQVPPVYLILGRKV